MIRAALTTVVATAVAAVGATLLPPLSPAISPAAAWSGSWSDPAFDYGASARTEVTCSERICVHRSVDGRHASSSQWADATLAHAERAWRVIVDDLGFRAPAASPSADGDPRLDVYLADLAPQGHYGQAVAGDGVPGQPRRSTSYLVIDNDMVGLGRSPRADLAATVAHEFFHAVQLNIDSGEDRWFMESSAAWAETQVFPQLHRNRQYVAQGQVGRRGVPLDSPLGQYGNHVFVERLTAVAGRDAVRQVWARLDASTGAPDDYSLEGVRAVLARHGVRWRDFYTGFAAANVTPGRAYPAHVGNTGQRPDSTVTLGPRRPRATFVGRLPHLTSRVASITVSSKARKRRLQLTLTSSDAARTGAVVLVQRRNGSIRRVPVTFNAAGRAKASVLVKRGAVRRVLVVTANSSAAYARCGRDSGWACGGVPLHDRTRVQVKARLT